MPTNYDAAKSIELILGSL
ncbi:MAG: hypothetical protein ACK5M3_14385 [Dysgonomonas sp.]